MRGISVASSRYAKAALTLAIHRRREAREAKLRQGWPDAALGSLDESIDRIHGIADVFDREPSDVLWQLIPKPETPEQTAPPPSTGHWDVFVSHAGEDTRPPFNSANSAVRLLTSPRPVSLRVQRMRSPTRSSIASAR